MTTTTCPSSEAAARGAADEREVERRAQLHREVQRLLADESIERKRRVYYRELYFALGNDPSAEDLERLTGCLHRARQRSQGETPVIPGSPEIRRAVAAITE